MNDNLHPTIKGIVLAYAPYLEMSTDQLARTMATDAFREAQDAGGTLEDCVNRAEEVYHNIVEREKSHASK